MSDEMVRLESRLAYLESDVQAMSQVVLEQGKSLQMNSLEIQKLTKRLNDLMENGVQDRESRRPPHY